MKTDIKRLDSVTHNDTAATKLINDNFSALQQGIEDSLSRSGKTPNFMDADLDMNEHKIINIHDPEDEGDLANKKYVDEQVAAERTQRQNEDSYLSGRIGEVGIALAGETNRAKGVEGNLSNLTTTNKTNLVGAINEVKSETDSKQDELVSGTNIKTINGETVLGSGNIAVQESLVSGANIKTINGTSILGSGNINIDTSSDCVFVKGTVTFNANSHTGYINVKDYVDASIAYYPIVYVEFSKTETIYARATFQIFTDDKRRVQIYRDPSSVNDSLEVSVSISLIPTDYQFSTTETDSVEGICNGQFNDSTYNLYYTKTETDTLLGAKQNTLTAGNNISIADGVISATDTTYSAFTGADGTSAGTAGLVPAPSATDNTKFLKGDGTWAEAGGGSSTGNAKFIGPIYQDITTLTTGKKRAIVDLASYFDNDDDKYYAYYVHIPDTLYLERVTSYKVTSTNKRKIQIDFSSDFPSIQIVVIVIAVPFGNDTIGSGYETTQPVFISNQGNINKNIFVDFQKIKKDLESYQTIANLVTSVDSSSTNDQYPSAKLFYDTCGDIETTLNTIRGV